MTCYVCEFADFMLASSIPFNHEHVAMKNYSLVLLTFLAFMSVSSNSLAAVFNEGSLTGHNTALAGCKAIVGAITTAGTGGVVNNAGSIRATGNGPNIVICTLNGVGGLVSRSGLRIVNVFIEDLNQNTVCNISSYNASGALDTSVSASPTLLLGSEVIRFTNLEAAFGAFTSNYQLSCRLDRGDIIHMYSYVGA